MIVIFVKRVVGSSFVCCDLQFLIDFCCVLRPVIMMQFETARHIVGITEDVTKVKERSAVAKLGGTEEI